MAAFALFAVGRRLTPRRCQLLALLALSSAAFSSCDRQSGESSRQFEGLKADLDESKRRISHIQNSLATKDKELAVSIQALETARTGMADLERSLDERNTQLRAAKTQIDDLKKGDAFVFAEIAAGQQQGQNAVAVARYQKFITDFPKSPLVTQANNAIAQLTEVQQEVRKQIAQLDPKKRERDFSKIFNEGYMTLQELAPVLKKKSITQVLGLLGKPNQTFNEGTELGYAERAINPATGTRGMLIVGFEGGSVASLRVEYAGRKMSP